MQSEAAIRDRLDELKESRDDYRDSVQLKEVDMQILTLEWVLGLGPEVVMVPKTV
jgi:hypothetical protein